MDCQLALLCRLGVFVQMRIDGDNRQLAYEFTAAAEFACRCHVGPIRMDARDFIARVVDGGSRAVNMPPLRAPAHLDALQHLGLEGRSIAFQGFELVGAGGFFEFG